MGTALLVAATELRRRLRDRSALMTAFVAPFALAAIMGIAFGGGSRQVFVRVGVADEEATPASRAAISSALAVAALPAQVSVVPVPNGVVARQEVAAGRLAGAVVIHPGAEVALAGGPPAPGRLPVEAFAGRGQRIGAQVVSALSQAVVGRWQAAFVVAAQLSPPAAGPAQRLRLADAELAQPVPVRLTDDKVAPQRQLIGYFGPSMAIVFLFLGAGAGARAIMAERETGTLARLHAAPVRSTSVLAGKVAAVVATALASILVVWAATVRLFHASWGDAGGVFVMCLATVLALAGVSTFVTVSARTPSQADSATTVIGFVLAILGGNFFPPGTLPRAVERVTLVTPNGWALQGFGTLALDGGHLRSVVTPLAVLAALAAVFGGAAWMRLRRVSGALG